MPTVSVVLDEKTVTIEAIENDTLYNQFEKNGVMLPHGCLAGSCGTCKVEILDGADQLKAPSAIEQNTLDSIAQNYPSAKGKTLRLSCRAKVQGKVVFKPFDGKAAR